MKIYFEEVYILKILCFLKLERKNWKANVSFAMSIYIYIWVYNEFWHISRDANFYISNVGEMPTQLCWVSQPAGVLGEWGRGSKPLLAHAIWVLALHWKILFGEQIHCCLAINLLHILQILAFIHPSSFKLDWKPFYPQ